MEPKIFDHVGVMIHLVDLEITNVLKNWLVPLQLAPEQYLVIALLLKKEGISQNDIANTLKKDKSSITRMLASLEQKGFIKRTGSAIDRRAVQVYLTDEGRALSDEVDRISSRTKELLNSGFTDEELTELKRLLMKVSGNVNPL
ncbi:MarR family winged helix-turn-helix transcriptional regulator [Paenibacillus macquariensis]|uniref:DNA-binding transcriptional regulator, MarR family n=1 Tax=Paenibacillus macquariensis TaxID=948756 RepID=A0ABY1JNF3_9BACL|nr:MarR family transcriptional regulator [Paenibacillus macquariensis]MEC0092174.1 MarR family transcriptional regulator [Paenibacillus macquariensis]OAB37275.1 transcriptional regulator [Paenibacillus macquariensis subsp. macquariensis]SIQ49688.1 DNA-binding transcriptional regulator, MarR family [Paenibacillus macquariensis]